LPSNNIAQKALTVKFISYRKSVKSHSQMKDLNKIKSHCLLHALANGLSARCFPRLHASSLELVALAGWLVGDGWCMVVATISYWLADSSC
jgi:hypothetical protein